MTSRDGLRLVSVTHSYDWHAGNALENVTLTVGQGEFWTILGPSGSGKSTLLRIIGGYIYPGKGKVLLNGRDITRTPPRERDMGMVFQDYALFPHMTAFENIAYGLRARRLSTMEIRERVGRMLELNHLLGLESRYPRQLSGGQQQRVALARALVINPTVLLMDEAMGALDMRLRESMEVEVRKIQRELGITTIHVTHDQAEAMTMSDRIVVLRSGRIEQIGSPHELNFNPASRYVAEFVGSNNVIPVSVRRCADGVWGSVLGVEGEVRLSSALLPAGQERNKSHALVIRIEEMKISSAPVPSGLAGIVIATKYLGTSRCLVVETEQQLRVLALDPTEQFAIGDLVHMSWPIDRALLISDAATSSDPPTAT